ncbi:hypothetical protein H072_9432 [Dactylellina haptotyla CBS 200.50]|uniref:DUF427 domain-containing protein n=1 Tax=Dactylellina haptotyla (strain CBS 200.50) TaxID=1284197 RepID=S8BP65_DACHA|nr:hypothetical protein H072_9432 [Dactylellina haptotyla CBS 200.50]
MTLTDKIKSIFKHETSGSSSSTMSSATAKVNGVVIAETDRYEKVEGNIYFPPESIKKEYFTETALHTTCPWKGLASYYTIDVGDGSPLTDAAWFYPEPKDAAANIKGYVAFYPNKVHINT